MCAQVLSPDYSNREWDSEEEDGFDPYWGVVDEGSLREEDVRGDAAFLVPQLAPLLGHHAPKCGLLRGLAAAAGIPVESVTRPGALPCLCAPAAPPLEADSDFWGCARYAADYGVSELNELTNLIPINIDGRIVRCGSVIRHEMSLQYVECRRRDKCIDISPTIPQAVESGTSSDESGGRLPVQGGGCASSSRTRGRRIRSGVRGRARISWRLSRCCRAS